MIRLKSVSGSGFRSFAKSFALSDLPDAGLVSLSGKSGAGKSSLVQAVAYVLGTMAETAKEQECWLPGAAPMEVSLGFNNGDEATTIKRSPSKAYLDNERGRAGGAKALNAALPEYFGMDMETLHLVTYRAQQSLGTFLTKSDADKKSTLWTLLGISQFENALEKLKIDQLAAKRDADRLREAPVQEPLSIDPPEEPNVFLIEDREFDFAPTTFKKFELYMFERGMTFLGEQPEESKQVEALQRELATLVGDAARAEAGIQSEYQRITHNGTPELAAAKQAAKDAEQAFHYANSAVNVATNQLAALQSKWKQIQNEAASLVGQEEGLNEKNATLKAEIEALKNGKCPTCSKPWENEAREQSLRQQLLSNEERLLKIAQRKQEMVESVPQIQSELVEAEAKADQARSAAPIAEEVFKQAKTARAAAEQNEQARAAALWQEQFIPRIAAIKEKLQLDTAAVNSKLQIAMASRQEWSQRRQTVEAATKEATLKYALARSKYETYTKVMESLKKERERFQKYKTELALADAQSALLSDARDVMQGFMDRVVQDVLAEINASADRLTVSVPNVSQMSLMLGLREKRGRAEIVAEISVDGNVVSYNQLSGGQKSVIALLTDLAIWEVVSRYRGGAMPGWLVLDEPFDGMGPEDIDACLEILERYAQDRLILVIHHATEFKKRFQKTYDIVRDNAGSSIELES